MTRTEIINFDIDPYLSEHLDVTDERSLDPPLERWFPAIQSIADLLKCLDQRSRGQSSDHAIATLRY